MGFSHICLSITYLSSGGPHLQSRDGGDAQLGEGVLLQLLQSEDGGHGHATGHYHIGSYTAREEIMGRDYQCSLSCL